MTVFLLPHDSIADEYLKSPSLTIALLRGNDSATHNQFGLAFPRQFFSVLAPFSIMQISSNHAGFNFQSVYKSVITRQVVPSDDRQLSMQSKVSAVNEEKADQMNRDALMLKAAQKSADRTASYCEALPDL